MSTPNQQTVVLATGNPGKVREMQAQLENLGIVVQPQSELGVSDAEEIGLSFVENAILKARNACEQTGLPAIADDSGLEVDALDGAPGIYSARYAGSNATDADNIQKLLNSLEGLPTTERQGRFRCVLVYMRHAKDPSPVICQGVWQGHILHQPAGTGGFGYDPIFWVKSEQCSAATLSKEQKNQISHRGQALAQLVNALNQKG